MMNQNQTYLTKYVEEFKNAYDAMLEAFRKYGSYALIDENGHETLVFHRYIDAVTKVVAVKMNTGKNAAKVKTLRTSGEYHYDRIVQKDDSSENMVESDDNLVDSIYSDEDGIYSDEDDVPSDEDISITEKIISSNKPETKSGEKYIVFETDDVKTCLVDKILEKELSEQYFLEKKDAQIAFCLISTTVSNTLCDLIKKLPKKIPIPGNEGKNGESNDTKDTKENNSSEENNSKKASYHMVSKDTVVYDEEGGTTTIGSMIADQNQDTEYAAIFPILFKYAKESFVHEVIASMLRNPHYLLAYLNTLAGRKAIDLCNDIINMGYESSLKTVTELVSNHGIDVKYLNDITFEWKKDIDNLKKNKNLVNNWADESRKIAKKMCVKKDIY